MIREVKVLLLRFNMNPSIQLLPARLGFSAQSDSILNPVSSSQSEIPRVTAWGLT